MTYKTRRARKDPLEVYDVKARELKELRERCAGMDFDVLNGCRYAHFVGVDFDCYKTFRELSALGSSYGDKEVEKLAEGIKMKCLEAYYTGREKSLEGQLNELGKKIDKKLGYT
jgi:hypothetical protein